MNYEPKKKNKKPEKISLTLFALSMVCVLFSNAVVDTMRWVFQLLTFGLLAAFIYILVRWTFTDFRYELKAKSKMETAPFEEIPAERLLFIVHRSQGKRGYTAEFMCDVDDIESVEPVSNTSPNTGKKFVFYRNMDKSNRYVMTVKGDNEPLLVFLELNDDAKDFIDFINNKIAG